MMATRKISSEMLCCKGIGSKRFLHGVNKIGWNEKSGKCFPIVQVICHGLFFHKVNPFMIIIIILLKSVLQQHQQQQYLIHRMIIVVQMKK